MSRDRKKEQKEGQRKLKAENNAKAIENRVWTKDWQEKRCGTEMGSRTGRVKADG